MKALDILAFGAHADDVEIGMAGTIAKHTKRGLRIGICDLTEAEMSSNGTVERRRGEAQQASDILGLTVRDNLLLPDRGLELRREHIDAVVRVIRRYRPRLVFMPYWKDRHPDHVQCSRIVEEAIFNAKLRRYLPDMPAHNVEQVFFYFINDIAPAQLVVDVTDVYHEKRKALRAYSSQFVYPSTTNNVVVTPLNQGYLEQIEARDALVGHASGFAMAESFAMKGPYAVAAIL